MTLSRRRFLAASSVVAWGATAPGLWRQVALAAPAADRPGAADTVLVVIELTGGNDGLNTAIPIRDPAYAAARPTLKQTIGKVKKVNDDLALHPVMSRLAGLFEKSQLAIIQGVGYPNPNRSHFVSMDFWHTATLKEGEPYGWLGRTADRIGATSGSLHIGGGNLPLALNGPAARAASLRSLAEYQLRVSPTGDDPSKRRIVEGFASSPENSGNGLLDLVKQSARETYKSAERLRAVGEKYDTPVKYPASGLAGRLKLIAQLIDAGVPERVYYTSLPGFDTHSDQAKQHADLLQELSDAIAAFQEDITHHGHQRRVLTTTFSEFGRRVKENGSLGTDHGAASQMFLVGDAVKAGVIGAHPSLTDLDDGDLKHHTDFRSVYATLLEHWLKLPPREILGADYPLLPLLKSQQPA